MVGRRALASLTLAAALLTGCPEAGPAPPGPGKTAGPRSTPTSTAPVGSSRKPQDLGTPPPQAIEASQVVVGQRYRFLTEQEGLTIRESWTVTQVEPGKEVRYDLHSRTEVAGADPQEKGPTPKVLRLAFDDAPPPPGPPPIEVGAETIEVGGVVFACRIYEQETTRRWISPRFPRLIKVEHAGKPFRRLIGIDPPK